MKRALLIVSLLLSVIGATGQPHHHRGHHRPHHGRQEMHVPGPRHPGGHPERRLEVPCIHDWQELWNGCYVRVKISGVAVLDRRDRKIVHGEEVYLLQNGDYKVWNGRFWRVYTSHGNRLGNVWGDSVELTPDGFYHCFRAGNMHVYDQRGHEHRFRHR